MDNSTYEHSCFSGGLPRVLIKDMKGAGADTWCHVPDEAWALINSIPRSNDGPFPYSVTSINASFNKACKVLKIKNLSFYDLRDEGIARLFEMGWDAPKAASVSGYLELGALGKYTDLSDSEVNRHCPGSLLIL